MSSKMFGALRLGDWDIEMNACRLGEETCMHLTSGIAESRVGTVCGKLRAGKVQAISATVLNNGM